MLGFRQRIIGIYGLVIFLIWRKISEIAKARPPSFVLFCSRADAVSQSCLRYLVNSMREYFELPGTPVRIALREKADPFARKRKRPS
jgi:KH-domain-like of EngA bacterial GTPase enzymes, C-terminal